MHRQRRPPRPEPAPATTDDHDLGDYDLGDLFAAPRWLRDAGTSAWLGVGVVLLVVGAIALLALTQTIVLPMLTAAVIAAVSMPIVLALERRRVPRAGAAAIVLLGAIALGAGVILLILSGIGSQASAIGGQLADAQDTLVRWLKDLGVDKATAEQARADAAAGASQGVTALLHGVAGGLRTLSSLVVFLTFTALGLFFMLKDSRLMRRWIERRMGVPAPVAHQIDERVVQSLRGYFLGVTFVAGFTAVLVGLGAWILGVPLAGTIAAVTFLGGYVPYLGAWAAGAFSVLMTLGGAGPEAALVMIVLQLLSNGALQQLIQPLAYGSTLDLHPLAVLVATIAGGSLFGAAGLLLAAPLMSAVTRISADLSARRPEAEAPSDPAPGAPDRVDGSTASPG
jgi:putative heme transporter